MNPESPSSWKQLAKDNKARYTRDRFEALRDLHKTILVLDRNQWLDTDLRSRLYDALFTPMWLDRDVVVLVRGIQVPDFSPSTEWALNNITAVKYARYKTLEYWFGKHNLTDDVANSMGITPSGVSKMALSSGHSIPEIRRNIKEKETW